MTKDERKKYNRAHYLANKSHYNEKAKQWRKQNPDKRRAIARRTKGLPEPTRICPELCEIGCGRQAKCLDHDHVTGRFRGWLCMQCNTSIGKMLDSPALLRAAASYLEQS